MDADHAPQGVNFARRNTHVLKLVAERGLVKGERIGVDGSTMEANAALRTIPGSSPGTGATMARATVRC